MTESQNVESSLADSLFERVDEANDFHDLVPIMTEIGIDIQEIRNMIRNKMRSMEHADVRKVAFNTLPINDLLSMDTVQHILSFYHFTDIQLVSKSFKECFHRNQNLLERSRQKFVEEYAHCFDPDVPFDASRNNTFVVRPPGQPLMESVKAIGDDIIVCDQFMDCFSHQKWSSGDRILLQNGRYGINDSLLIVDRNHQIIGLGENVEIHITDTGDQYMAMVLGGNSKVLIQNVSIKTISGCGQLECVCTNDPDYSAIAVTNQSILWMQTCNLQGGHTCVNVDQYAFAHFKSCQFAAVESAIKIECVRKKEESPMMILDCSFAEHKSCIETNVPVTCIGNHFTTNKGGLVVTCGRERLNELINRSVLLGAVFSKPMHQTLNRESV